MEHYKNFLRKELAGYFVEALIHERLTHIKEIISESAKDFNYTEFGGK
jgi:hypothetical protein